MDDTRAQEISERLIAQGYELSPEEVKLEFYAALEAIRGAMLAKGHHVPADNEELMQAVHKAILWRDHRGLQEEALNADG